VGGGACASKSEAKARIPRVLRILAENIVKLLGGGVWIGVRPTDSDWKASSA
jgi:hypothetical protein